MNCTKAPILDSARTNTQTVREHRPISSALACTTAIALAITGFAATPMAFAQENTGDNDDVRVQETIIVTARRRDESLTDVPDSLRVFSGATIEDANIGELNDVAVLTPGLFVSDYQEVGRADISLRGLSSVVVGDSPVAVLVDGVTLPTSIGVVQELFDVQQIEVLRGPQGALYGRNAIGGAINVTTKKPTNEFEAQIRAGIGNRNTYRAAGSLSGPIAENVFFRVSAFYEESDGLFENATLNEDAGFKESTSVRGRLLWDATEDLSFDLRASYSDKEGESALWHWADTSAFPVPLTSDFGTVQTNEVGFSEFEGNDVTLKVDWETPIGLLTSTSAYLDQTAFNFQDGDFAAWNSHIFRIDDQSETFQQELRLTSDGDRSVRYAAGIFYQTSERDRRFFLDISESCRDLGAADPNVGFLDAVLFPGAACVIADFITYDASLLGDTSPFVNALVAPQDLESDSFGIFGQLNIDLSDQWELTLAARHDSEDRTDNVPGVDLEFNEFQPKVTLTYFPREGSQIYATYSTGFRPGGINPRADIQTYDAETLDNYEVGFKLGLPGNTLLTAATYYTEIDNQQFFLYDAAGATQNIINAESSTIWGGEIELTSKLGSDFDVFLGASWIDGEIEEFGDGIDPTSILFDQNAVDGNVIPYNPEYSLVASLQHETDLSTDWSLRSRVDVQHQGEINWFYDNLDVEDPYTLVNLSFTLERENWSLTAYSKNLLDEDYNVSIFPVEATGLPGDFFWRGNPRTWGLNLTAKF